MPGTSETFEDKNFEGVANKLVDAIRFMLNHFSLEQMVGFLHEGVSEKIQKRYGSIRDEEWRWILNNVIFSKITSFELNRYSTEVQIHYLIELLSDSFHYFRPNTLQTSSRLLPKDLPANYLIAQKWLNKAYGLLRLKAKKSGV